ncbi:MAG: MaoC family dehydratase N-terminal domain-containing protein [Dehalococcoidia bacterium]|nr:MaoC family dehydratase N-terminal domain-containing protein [Dehalococcoidia bacterium]
MSQSVAEIYEEARKLIGTETAVVKGRYPVEYDPIRRHCDMVADANPLFLEPEYARQTKHGAVLCPPTLVGYFAENGAWPPVAAPLLPVIPTAGNRAINLTVEAEWFKPVKVGDQLYQKLRLADVYIKPIKLDPKAFWLQTERVVTNQNGEVVYIERKLAVRHRTPEQIKAAEEAGDN